MKILKKLEPQTFFAALYASFVWEAFFYLNISQKKVPNMFFITILFVCEYIIINYILKKIRQYKFYCDNLITKKNKKIIFLVIMFLTLAIMMTYVFAYYPGSFSSDSIGQYGQAINGIYSDWHPVWHTLVFFTFPLKIFKNIASIIIMQNIYFALIMGYVAVTIYEMTNIKVMILSMLYILMNPYVGHIMLYPWKDVGFALAGLFCTTFAIRLIFIKENTTKIWKLVLFGFALASATLFRHNAILYTAPLLLVLFLKIDRKTWTKIVIISIMFLLLIKIPIYGTLNVTNPDRRVLESTGLPLSIIGNVVKETPELMDNELSEFAYSLAPQELWNEKYQCGNFNSIKWNIQDTTPVEKQGYIGMFRLMLKCFSVSPKASFKAFFSLTDVVYGFENGLEGDVGTGIVENKYGIEYQINPNRLLDISRIAIEGYGAFVNNSIFRYLRTYGVCLFVLVVVYFAELKFKSWTSWNRLFIIGPLFVYDFGTMLLLTGPDSRFFFITFLVTPILVVYALCEGGNTDEASNSYWSRTSRIDSGI